MIISDIKNTRLIDDDLILIFVDKTPVSVPDTDVYGYHFKLVNANTYTEMGGINIKAGYTDNIINYRGNIGFTVYEEFRGKHYSARSCNLLVPIIALLKMDPIWITCNADNIASKKNIERIGAIYQETVKIPNDYIHVSYYSENARIKMRYKWEPEQQQKRSAQKKN